MVLSPTLTRPAVQPSRERIHKLFEQGDHVPVYRTLLADLETPVSVYMKLAQSGDVSFLLESVEGGERVGRYSFLGVNPKGVISVKDDLVTRTLHGVTTTRPLNEGEDPLHAIEKEFGRVTPVRVEGLPRFIGGAVGCLSYDIVRYFERLPETATRDLDVPDAAFMLIDTLVIFDHAKHQLIILAHAHNTDGSQGADDAYDDAVRRIDAITEALLQPLVIPPDAPPVEDELRSNVTREQYEENVRSAKEYIAAGCLPDRDLAAPEPENQRFAADDLPRITRDQPVAVYVPPALQ
jgi:anthranilate synthase component 1